MASRDKNQLRPELVSAYELAAKKYFELYPKEPQPFITCTYRSNEEQNELYAKGRSVKGSIITNAKAGQSPHNFNPSFAFDIAFIKVDKTVTWENKYFVKFANCIKEVSEVTDWGGDWHNFKDAPHFELRNWKNLK